MDPDQTLEDIRETLSQIKALGSASIDDDEFSVYETQLIDEVVENFEALDEWLVNKGFLPKDWERGS